MYDVSNQPSFDKLPDWLRELKQHINDRVITVLVGNKNDLTESREIPYHIAESFAQRHNMQFVETSAKNSENVENIFIDIAKTLTKQANELYSTRGSGTGGQKLTDGSPNTQPVNGSCCPI